MMRGDNPDLAIARRFPHNLSSNQLHFQLTILCDKGKQVSVAVTEL
jgi:hypothetical protein